MLVVAVAVLALAAGCGPRGPRDNRPPNRPPGPAAPNYAGTTITFWAWTYAPNGDEMVASVGFILTSLTADGNPATITRDDGTTQEAVFTEPAVLSPYGAEVTLGPGVAAVTFLLSATLPKGSTLECEVRDGPRTNPHAPVISGNAFRIASQENALPVANGTVLCSFPT